MLRKTRFVLFAVVTSIVIAAGFTFAMSPEAFLPGDVICLPRPFEHAQLCTRTNRPAECVILYDDGRDERCVRYLARHGVHK